MKRPGGHIRRRRALSVLAGGALVGALVLGSGAAASPATAGGIQGSKHSATELASRVEPRRDQVEPAAPTINPPGTTERSSVSSAGVEGDGQSGGSSGYLPSRNPDQAISADGRWVAFVSYASNLTDQVGASPVFLHDRQTGTTTAIPWVYGDTFPFGIWVGEVSISAHGEVVAFTAYPVQTTFEYDSIVGFQPSETSFLVVWRQSDGKSLILTRGQLAINGRQPAVSADGRFVAYTAVPTPSPTPTPAPTPSPAPSAIPTPSDTTPPSLSWNVVPEAIVCPTGGVTFWVNASDASGVSSVRMYYWPPGGSSWLSQAMLRSPGTTIWSTTLTYPSGASSWAGYNFFYYAGAFDTHGNFSKLPASGYNTMKVAAYCIGSTPSSVTFASAHVMPTPGPVTLAAPSLPTQVAVFDLETGGVTTVSHDASGNQGSLSSSKPSISADGQYVAFASDASLVSDDGNNRSDIYRWDATAANVSRISVAVGGGDADDSSSSPSISGDGTAIAFASKSTKLTRDLGQLAGVDQIFVWRSSRISLVSVGGSGPGSAPSYGPSISQDGRVVAFDSDAANLIDNDTNGKGDVFLRNVARGVTIRASVDDGGRQGSGESQRPSVSGEGRAVAFDSSSTSLVPNDGNADIDVFVRDLPPALQVAPAKLEFGTFLLGTPSAAQAAIATSVGWTPVAMQDSSISGTNPDDFGASDLCSTTTLDIGDSCTINVDFVPQAKGPRAAVLDLTDTAPDSPQHVDLFGGAGAPELVLNPTLGSLGTVTTATGSGFPPGAVVELRWDPGLTAWPNTVSVGKDGTFTIQVLIFHNDVIGLRTLTAGAAAGSPAFAPGTADFLVVPAPLQPPATGTIRYLAPGLELIVIRR